MKMIELNKQIEAAQKGICDWVYAHPDGDTLPARGFFCRIKTPEKGDCNCPEIARAALETAESEQAMTIENCPQCGGTHYGTNKCPFIEAPCVICGEPTVMACSDCSINSGGRNSVHVCGKRGCRIKHEAEAHPTPPLSASEPAGALTGMTPQQAYYAEHYAEMHSRSPEAYAQGFAAGASEVERLRAENVSLYEKIEALQEQMVKVCAEAADEILRLQKELAALKETRNENT